MEVIARESQIKMFSSIIDNEINVPLIAIYGPTSSGKSTIVNHVLKEKKINYVDVECNIIRNNRHFFSILLNGLYDKFHTINNSDQQNHWTAVSRYTFCHSPARFMRILQIDDFAKQNSFYVILHHFSKLYEKLAANTIASLIETTQSELSFDATNSNKIGFVLIDDPTCMINIQQRLSYRENNVFYIHFPAYTNKEIQRILLSITKKRFESLTIPVTQIQSIIKLLVHTFITHTTRIDDYLTYLTVLLPKCAQNSNENNDINAIKTIICQLSKQIIQSQDITLRYDLNDNDNEHKSDESQMREPDLQYEAQFLLLCAYLASFNSHDFNTFAFAEQKKKLKKRKQKKWKEKHNFRQKGPRAFTIKELSGIFISLWKLEHHGDTEKLQHLKSVDIKPYISRTISMHYISNVSADGTLDNTQFKCNLNHDYARFIANKIGIASWDAYLEEE